MDENCDFMISMFYKTSLKGISRKLVFFVSPTQWKNRCKSIWIFSSPQVDVEKEKNTYIWKQHISRILLHGWRSFTSYHLCKHPFIWDVLLSFQADRNDGTPAAPCGVPNVIPTPLRIHGTTVYLRNPWMVDVYAEYRYIFQQYHTWIIWKINFNAILDHVIPTFWKQRLKHKSYFNKPNHQTIFTQCLIYSSFCSENYYVSIARLFVCSSLSTSQLIMSPFYVLPPHVSPITQCFKR